MKGRWLKLFLTAAALVGLVPAAMLYAATRTAPLRQNRGYGVDRHKRSGSAGRPAS